MEKEIESQRQNYLIDIAYAIKTQKEDWLNFEETIEELFSNINQ